MVAGREGHTVVVADRWEQAVDEKAVGEWLFAGGVIDESDELEERRLGDSSVQVDELAMGWR
jgi:hypothetical protein